MDPIALIRHLLVLSKAISERAKLVNHNVEQCNVLANRIQDIAVALQGLLTLPDHHRFIHLFVSSPYLMATA